VELEHGVIPLRFDRVENRGRLAWSVTAQGPTELGPAPDYVVGLWGVERAALEELGNDADRMLGRRIPRELTARGYCGDVEAQCVCGLLNYRRHFDHAVEGLPVGLRAAMAHDTSAAWRVAAWAYSSGPRRARALLEAFAVDLRTVEPRAWAGWLAGAVSRCTSGDRLDGERVGGKWRLAFMLLRAEQRAASAEELGRQVLGVEELATLRGWLGLWAVRDGAQVVERLKVLADA
jgi:hypothetical protein